VRFGLEWEEGVCCSVGSCRKRAHALQWEGSACSSESVGRERMLFSGKRAHALQREGSACSPVGSEHMFFNGKLWRT
jgi:hypothetical protein